MMNRSVFWVGFALAALHSGFAVAADRSARNTGLPSLDEIQPLGKTGRIAGSGFFRDVRVSIEASYGETKHKAGQPANLRQYSAGARLDVSSRLGDIGFASVSGSFSEERISSTVVQFPLDIEADGQARGAEVILGIMPLPFLRAGFIGGLGNADATYDFTAFSAPSDSFGSTYRYGGFVGGSYPAGPVALHADAAYLRVRNEQTYEPTNSVQIAKSGGEYLALQLGASYEATPKLNLSGAIALNQVLSQTVAPADTPMDETWMTAQLRVGYMVTDQIELSLKGLAWLGNDKFDYTRVTLGASYRF